MLRREAAEGIRPVAGDRLLAPNEYIITLGMHDYQKVGADPDLTSDAFAKHLARYIGEQGWQTYGDVVIRFEQSANLHTGQFRTRGAVNPDVEPRPTAGELAPPQSDHAFSAEPGVPAMSENSSYGGGQGQGRPGDDYYDDPYAHPHDDPHAAPDPRAGYQPRPDAGGYPDQPGYGAPDHARRLPRPRRLPAAVRAAPGRRLPRPSRLRRTRPARRLPRPGRLPRPARRLPRAARRLPRPRRLPAHTSSGRRSYGGGQPYEGGQRPGHAAAPRPGLRRVRRLRPGQARHDEGGYGAPEQRGGYPDQGALPDQAAATPSRVRATTRATASSGYGRQDYGQSYAPPGGGGGYAEPGRDYDYGQPADASGYGGATDNRAATRPRARRSRCNSTTAAGAPISYVKARTSLAAARMHSSGCRTPVCRVATWRFGGTAKSRCCPTSTPPTAPPSTTRLFRSGSWPTAM